MSPFSQPASSSSTAVNNPFAPRNNNTNPKPFASPSPFASQSKPAGDGAAASSGGFGKPSGSGPAASKFTKKKHPLAQEVKFDSDDERRRANNGGQGKVGKAVRNPFQNDASSGDESRKKKFPNSNNNKWTKNAANGAGTNRTFSAGKSMAPPPPPAAPVKTNDAHAKRVYDQLHKDGIHPPQWPSQPGNPDSKVQMAKFREQYETYRDKVRASLTKAGIIDDPEKRKSLRDAIDFKGICEDMCPEYEKIQRITELDVHQPEKDSETGFASTARMIKKLARSAAGQEAPLPMDVRSVASLRRTLDYLIDDLLREDGNLPVLHGFLWDRTRALRRDFTFFSALTPEELKSQVYVLENIARFHVTALHLLSQEGVAPEDFVEQQELEQLGKALLSLRDLYDDCDAQGIVCDNEAEFRAYYLVFHADDPNIMETLQRQWRSKLWKESDEIRTAVSLLEALQDTDKFHGPLKGAPSLAASGASHAYFRIMQSPKVSYTMACFAECHLPYLRRSILRKIKRGLARPKDTGKDVTAEVLNRFLQFDTVQEAIEFAELHDLQFANDEEDPSNPNRRYLVLNLNDRSSLPRPRLQHQFSYNLVERKRGSAPLPSLIHGTVFESGDTSNSSEQSLFVHEAKPAAPAQAVSSGFGVGQPASGFTQAPSGTQGTSSPFAPSSTPQGASPFAAPAKPAMPFAPAANPFAPAAQTSSSAAPTANPFASGTPSTTPAAQHSLPSDKSNGLSTPPVAQPATTQSSPFSFLSQTPTATTPTSQPASKPGSFDFLSKPASPADASAAKPPSFDFLSKLAPFPTSTSTPSTTLPSFSRPEAAGSDTNPLTSASPAGEPVAKPSPPIFPPQTSFASPQQSLPKDASSALGATGASSPFGAAMPSPTFKPPPTSNDGTLAGSKGSKFTDTINLGPGLNSSSTPSVPSVPSIVLSSPTTASGTPGQTASSQFAPLQGLGATSTNFSNSLSQESNALAEQRTPEPLKPLPRDLMGDFTKWFVLGDDGMMEQFTIFVLENIVPDVFETFQNEEKERIRLEEEERNNKEADAFRLKSVSVKYFYLWRDHARERRLRELRRSGREQLRAYNEERRAAKRQAQEEAAREAAEMQKQIKSLDRSQELRDLLSTKKLSKRKAEKALLASGVLSGVSNEQEAVAAIVGQMSEASYDAESSRQSSQTPSETRRKEGAKTKALREMYQPSFSGSFRRSLPAMTSRSSASPARTTSPSRASERWRLKAMGIVQLPDGTAVPESLIDDTGSFNGRYGQLSNGSFRTPQRRVSSLSKADDAYGLNDPSGAQPLPSREMDDGLSSLTHKRKRPADENDVDLDNGDGKPVKNSSSDASAHKRVMSEVEKTVQELRALRAELEEGTEWFKSQSEKLRGEIASRASTPWDGVA